MPKHASTPQSSTAPPALDTLITDEEFARRSTLSRSTRWRLRHDDPMLAKAFVRLTEHRIAWREALVQAWIEARSGPRPRRARQSRQDEAPVGA
jgi:predicted DNA-binding transcriptional regulator AlpA